MTDQAPLPPPTEPSSSLRAMTGGLRRGFESLGVRNYRLYWIGQVISLVGTWMQQVSMPWLVLALGGSPIQLGIVVALEFAPAMLLAPFGGVFADRIDKRHVLIAAGSASALQATVLFALTITGSIEIWMVMVLGMWRGLVNAVEMPTRQSLAADLVPRRLLANAIALNSMAFNSARVVGPATAGVIIALGTTLSGSATTGVAVNFGINAVTFAGVIGGLLLMNPREIRRAVQPERHPPVLESLREGFWFAVRTPLVLWCLVLLAGIASFGFNFQILLPLFANDVLGLGAEGYGALYATMGIGSLAGSLTLAVMRRREAVPLMLIGGSVFSVLLVGLGLSRHVVLVAPLVLATGYFSMLMLNTINATVQANVTDALRGRVMSFYVTVFAGSAPIGGLFAGAIAEAWGAPSAFLAGAAMSALTVALVALGIRAAARRGSLGVTTLDASGGKTPRGSAAEPRGVSAAR